MHTQQLSINQQDHSRETERSEEAAILAEIASRLVDHSKATSVYRTKALMRKWYCLTQLDTEAFMVYLHLQTGDLSELTRSYQEQAKEHALDKQAIQQRIERVITSLQKHFPALAQAVIDLRHITAEIPIVTGHK